MNGTINRTGIISHFESKLVEGERLHGMTRQLILEHTDQGLSVLGFKMIEGRNAGIYYKYTSPITLAEYTQRRIEGKRS